MITPTSFTFKFGLFDDQVGGFEPELWYEGTYRRFPNDQQLNQLIDKTMYGLNLPIKV